MGIKHYFQEYSVGVEGPAVVRLVDMLANSPAELVSAGRAPATDVPAQDKNIRGRYSSLSVDDDIHYFSFDMICETSFETRGLVPSGIWVGAMFNGGMRAWFDDCRVQFTGNGQPRMFSFGGTQEITDRREPNERIRMSSFLVAENFFDRQLALNETSPMSALKALIVPGVHEHALARRDMLADALLRLLNSPYQGQTERLFLESTVIATVFQLSPLRKANDEGSYPRSQPDLAFEARHLIDTNPESFETIHALARALNTNETTLQRQFKAKFDLTVFQYVLLRRMQAARVLIKDGHLQIAEVAYRVGYNSPASFSTAYRRYYGHTPQDERGKP